MAVMTDARATFLAIVKGDTSQAVTEFRKLGSTVEKETTGANTSVGKFRSYTSSAFAEVKANAGLLAAGAGAALVAFGVQSANAFSQAAKAAIDLGQKTGFSTEQASRWIAVADDFQVSADTLATSVGRIAKDLDSDKWAKYGIATRDAAGNARSANDIFLDVLDVLSRTDNETERARLGAELLGRGWQGVAPILGKTRREYEDMLASVDRGQVITEGEAQRAEEWRMANDKLGESFGLFADALGQVFVELAPVVELFADATAKVMDLREALQADSADDPKNFFFGTVAGQWDFFWEKTIGRFTEAEDATEQVTTATRRWWDSLNEANAAVDDYVRSGHADALGRAFRQTSKLYDATWELTALLRGLDAEEAVLNLEQDFLALNDAAAAAWEATASGAENARATTADYEQQMIDVKRSVADYATEVYGLPASVTTEVMAAIDRGEVRSIEELLNYLARQRDVMLQVKYNLPSWVRVGPGGDLVGVITPGRQYASGTPSAAPGLALVGEQGPELVSFRGGERVYTANQTAGMLSGGGGSGRAGIHIEHVTVVANDPREFMRQMAEYQRRGY